MDFSLWILVGLLSLASGIALYQGGWRLVLRGVKEAGLTFKSMWYRLLLGFTLGGLIQVLIPGQLIADWLGPASGLKGILIASYAGIIVTGGPYVALPVIASIYTAGAGPGPVMAMLTSLNLLSLPTLLTWEIPFLGSRLALSRFIVCLLVPPLVGLAGAAIFRLF